MPSNAHQQTLTPTKIGWKSHKIDEKSRRFINHFRDFLCFNGYVPKNAIFVGIGVYENASFSTSMSNIFSKPFFYKNISPSLQWTATRWNREQLGTYDTWRKKLLFLFKRYLLSSTETVMHYIWKIYIKRKYFLLV